MTLAPDNAQAPAGRAQGPRIVHVVDDDDAVRDSLRWLFEGEGYDVRTYASALDLLARARPPMSGVVLLDIRMPGMTGLELLQGYVPQVVDAPVVVLTAHGDVPLAVQCLRAGARDMLVKPVPPRELITLVETLANTSAETLPDRALTADLRRRLGTLTPRERQVLEVLVEGRTSREIGLQLGISHKTVDIHRGRVLQKLMMDSVSDLIRLVTRHGLL